MGFKALVYAYILGGFTFIPLVLVGLVAFTIYTAVPVGELDPQKFARGLLESESAGQTDVIDEAEEANTELNDAPRTRRGWLTVRRTFEESSFDGGYVTLVRSFLDARSKDPKRSRPKDMWYVVLKGKVMYLYEDEAMSDCEAAIELSGHDVVIYPEDLPDGELFAKRNAICLKPKRTSEKTMPSVTKEMKLEEPDIEAELDEAGLRKKKARERERERLEQVQHLQQLAREEAFNPELPWFIFVRSNVEMEDWYLSLIHASDNPSPTPTLHPLRAVFNAADMSHLVSTLDEQPDVIPMRWFNAVLGRIFFSHYRTQALESFIIGRLMKKLSKVKIPAFLTDVVVSEVSVGNKAPMFSKPMLKELTREGDAAMEVHLSYKGEIRITAEATANIQIGTFKSYNVKLVLAAVVREVEGNLLIKVKRPPSNRIWYAFTQTPRMVMSVEPVVSDRQVTWGMILGTIESKLKEIIQESVVMPNMDDIAYSDSLPYMHRGGIWSDAARHERSHTSPSSGENISGDQEESRGPVIDISTEAGQETVSLNDLASSPELSTSPRSEPEALRTSTMPKPNEAPNQSKSRRRTWFSSIGNPEDAEILSDSGDNITKSTTRGRSIDIAAQNIAHRSSSTPGQAETVDTSNHVERSEKKSDLQDFLSPSQFRRSSSQQSSHREESKDTSEGSTSSSYPESSVLSRNRDGNDPNQTYNPPASPTGFLSTLRARAADKQTINNAKDTMRKWGANWASLRKESTSSGEDVPDHGSIGDARMRTQSTGSALSHKARASYADLRAAVADRVTDRRERSGDDNDVTPFRTSSPISTPAPLAKPKSRAVSYPNGPEDSGSSNSHTNSSSSSSTAPSQNLPGEATMTAGMLRGGSEPPSESGSGERSPPNPVPIRFQPQAKTMTIPGIHAKHRGEVMSMGYVAPEPQQPESKMKSGPALQSISKLWKSGPSDQPQSPPAVPEDSPENVDSLSTPSAQPSDSVHSSPSPTHRIASPISPSSTFTGLSRPPLNPPKLSSDSNQSSSDALKSIAIKDDNKRASLDLSNSSPTRTRKSSLTAGLFRTLSGDTPTERSQSSESITSNHGRDLSNPL